MAKNLGDVTIDFSQMPLYEIYAMQNVIVVKMKLREGTLINKKEKISNKVVSKMKKTIKEAGQKSKTWEEDRHMIDNVVALACYNFVDEGIT